MEELIKELVLKPQFQIPLVWIRHRITEKMPNANTNWEEYKRQMPIMREKIIDQAINGLRENFDDFAIFDYNENSISCSIDFQVTPDQLERIKEKELCYDLNDIK